MRLIFVTGYFLFCSTQVAGDTSQQVACALHPESFQASAT